MKRAEAGFTLLEILVALAVLGLVLLQLYGGLDLTLSAAERQATMIGRTGDYDATDRALRRLLASADPGGPGLVPLRGTQGTVTFTSTLPQGGGPAEIGIGLQAGTLWLRWSPQRYGRPFGPGPAPRQAELLRGAQSVALAYFSPKGWQSEWNGPDLPALLRLRVVFPPGDTRHWPDMVLATQRQRPP